MRCQIEERFMISLLCCVFKCCQLWEINVLLPASKNNFDVIKQQLRCEQTLNRKFLKVRGKSKNKLILCERAALAENYGKIVLKNSSWLGH